MCNVCNRDQDGDQDQELHILEFDNGSYLRAFHLETLHFVESHTLRYMILRPTVQINVLFWPFGFDLFNRSSILAFQKCYGLGFFDQLIVHGINFIFQTKVNFVSK